MTTPPGALRVLSWNLLKAKGATAPHIADLIERHRPGLVLMQEASARIDALPTLAGGHFIRHEMPPRGHGPAAWSPDPFNCVTEPLPRATRADLPVPILRSTAPRLALILRLGALEVANIHLDHGQRANRRQLRHLLASHPGLSIIMGDTNAIGPTTLPGFTDAGPRTRTHWAYDILPVRLDRCLIRGLTCTAASALEWGPSDHRPILVDLQPGPIIASNAGSN